MNSAKFPVIVNVTAEDIKAGIPEDCGLCPIALAVRRAFPSYGILVTGCDIEVFRTKESLADLLIDDDRFHLDINDNDWDLIGNFVSDFDYNHEVKPFSFTVLGFTNC